MKPESYESNIMNQAGRYVCSKERRVSRPFKNQNPLQMCVCVCLGVSVLHTVLERECVNTPPLVEYVFVCLEIETHIGSIRAMGRGTGCEYQIASESP